MLEFCGPKDLPHRSDLPKTSCKAFLLRYAWTLVEKRHVGGIIFDGPYNRECGGREH
jgi:hypothetical protein